MSERTKHDVEIQNVVAVATLDQNMDLLAIMKIFRNAEYRPKRFPGLVFRLKTPKTTTLVFRSGKMVLTGAKKEDQLNDAAEKMISILIENDLVYSSRLRVESQTR